MSLLVDGEVVEVDEVECARLNHMALVSEPVEPLPRNPVSWASTPRLRASEAKVHLQAGEEFRNASPHTRGRPQKWQSNAEKQRAWRSRKRAKTAEYACREVAKPKREQPAELRRAPKVLAA